MQISLPKTREAVLTTLMVLAVPAVWTLSSCMGGTDLAGQNAASPQSARPELNALIANSAMNVLLNGQGLQNSVSCSAAQKSVDDAETNLVNLPQFQGLAQTSAWGSLTAALQSVSPACAPKTSNAVADPNLPTCKPGQSPTMPNPEEPNSTITVCNPNSPTANPNNPNNPSNPNNPNSTVPTTPAPGGSGYPGMVAKLQKQCANPDTAAQACPQYYQVIAHFRKECATPIATQPNFAPTCEWLATDPVGAASAPNDGCTGATNQVQASTVQVEARPEFNDVQSTPQWTAFVNASVNFTKCNAN